MAGRVRGEQTPPAVLRAMPDGGGSEGEPSMARRDDELRRMAAFRVRETANRVATLAQAAQDEGLRSALKVLSQRLLDEERGLLDGTESANAR